MFPSEMPEPNHLPPDKGSLGLRILTATLRNVIS